MKMVKFSFLISLFFSLVRSEGEFIIVRSPPSVSFKNEEIDSNLVSNLIPDICAASLGFTPRHESDWQGFQIVNPFNFANAVVILYVDGIPTLGMSTQFQKFPLDVSTDEETIWNALKNEIINRYPTENNTLLRVELGYGSDDLGDIKTKHLNKDVEEDAYFMQELKDLESYAEAIEKKDGIPDLYWYVLRSLHTLNDVKGTYDPSTIEAREMVYEALSRVGELYDKAYNSRVLVAAIVSDASHTRRTRGIIDDNDVKNNTDINVAEKSSDDFPAIFNIILWFSVAFVLSLISISVFIASMDPGRDSIIYRMTSNRMKKDS